MSIKFTEDDINRFKKNCDTSNSDDCWFWKTGDKLDNQKFTIDGSRYMIKTAAIILFNNGGPLSFDLHDKVNNHIKQTCGTKNCVNPKHLVFTGVLSYLEEQRNKPPVASGEYGFLTKTKLGKTIYVASQEELDKYNSLEEFNQRCDGKNYFLINRIKKYYKNMALKGWINTSFVKQILELNCETDYDLYKEFIEDTDFHKPFEHFRDDMIATRLKFLEKVDDITIYNFLNGLIKIEQEKPLQSVFKEPLDEDIKYELKQKFLKNTEKIDDNCRVYSNRLGRFYYKNLKIPAERVSFHLFKDFLSVGTQIKKTCGRPNCVNFAHLEYSGKKFLFPITVMKGYLFEKNSKSKKWWELI